MARYWTPIALVVGALAGVLGYDTWLAARGSMTVDAQDWQQQQELIRELRTENQLLTEELFAPRDQSAGYDPLDPPYDESADARLALDVARARAMSESKILMVTFGANWCTDCRSLSRSLRNEDVAEYLSQHFVLLNVDVGKFNRNRDLAAELGATLDNGIPVAVFFDADGNLVGTTNEGQLEPARLYSSRQILKFVRDVAERSRILAPDAVE